MTLELGTSVFAAGLLAVALGVGCANGLGPDDFPSSDDDDGTSTDPGSGGALPNQTTTTTTTTTTTSTTTTTTTTSVGPSSGSGSTCDNSGDCGTCANCSLNQACAAEMNACFNDPDCSAFIDCLNNCFDEVCANACADTYPNGVNGYMALTVCAFCAACPNDCAVEGQGLCP